MWEGHEGFSVAAVEGGVAIWLVTGGDLLELSAASGWQPARRDGPQSVLQLQEIEFGQQPEWVWKWNFPPELSDENSAWPAPCFQPGDTLSGEPGHAMPIPCLDFWPNVNRRRSRHQVCGNLLPGNRKLRHGPNLCQQPLFHPSRVFPGLRLGCSATLVLGRLEYFHQDCLVMFAQWYQMLICVFIS